ncbi:MAG TPA: hypothetical protein VMN37_04370 [Gemmatimonadales bacterium]|nr:hypothetical protein [Gemmatimonadales bacterium]
MTGASCWWASAGGSPRFGAGLRPLLLLAALACGAPRSDPPDQLAPWLRADPRRCLLQRDLAEGMEVMARRCAEAFVRDNGYTAAPATEDSSRWVLEIGERADWPGVLALREGTLEPDASTVQCSARQCVVLFRLRRASLECAYRSVTMTQVFTRLRLEPGGIRNMRCAERRV